MRLCRFWRPGPGAAIGLVQDEHVYDLTALDQEQFRSFTGLLNGGDLAGRLESAGRDLTSAVGSWQELDIQPDPARPHLLAPITKQEVWGAGVTYMRSREARMGESPDGGSFYDKVYQAARPELFFKGTANRVAGPNAPIRIRSDSHWNVPEPELALMVNARGQLIGFTIGNDMSSRDIEGENPLYLPQAKVYQGSCALGPVVIPLQAIADPRTLSIRLVILRGNVVCFEGSTTIAMMKRSFEELISYLFRDQEFPHGVILLTGTGVVPPDSFTLQPGDRVEITIPEIGILRNTVLGSKKIHGD
jgi:2-dehydro-3-deoxy-D-arabinonate dehydratase